MQMYQQLRTNPMQMLTRRFNLPQNVNINNPNDIIQYLLNTGQIQQQQYNSARQYAEQLMKQNNH
jgi:hypothetical protein